MRTSHKLSLAAGTVLLGITAAVYAHPGGMPVGMGGPGMMHGGMGPGAMHGGMGPGAMHGGPGFAGMQAPGERMAAHLAEVREALKLRPDQSAAWETFSQTVTAQMAGMAGMREQMWGAAPDAKPLPERMDQRMEMMQQGFSRMQAMSLAVKTFYATLTPEQQAIADRLMPSPHGPRVAAR